MSLTSHNAGQPTTSSLWLAASRPVATLLLTAFVVATENLLEERLFHPELYAAGPWLVRWGGVFVLSIPLILSGLLFLGLPVSYALGRMRAETAPNYAIAGLATGAVWGVLLTDRVISDVVKTAFFGAVCLLFWWLFRPNR